MRELIATKETKLYDSYTNEVVEVVKKGQVLGIEADAPLKRQVGAVVQTVTEVYRRVLKRGETVHRFLWFVPAKQPKTVNPTPEPEKVEETQVEPVNEV